MRNPWFTESGHVTAEFVYTNGSYGRVPSVPTLIKAHTMLVPIFAKKGHFFNGRREFGKRVIFQARVREISAKGTMVYVIISICFFRMFELLCINVFVL